MICLTRSGMLIAPDPIFKSLPIESWKTNDFWQQFLLCLLSQDCFVSFRHTIVQMYGMTEQRNYKSFNQWQHSPALHCIGIGWKTGRRPRFRHTVVWWYDKRKLDGLGLRFFRPAFTPAARLGARLTFLPCINHASKQTYLNRLGIL